MPDHQPSLFDPSEPDGSNASEVTIDPSESDAGSDDTSTTRGSGEPSDERALVDGEIVVRVLPDEPAIGREFDYLVPASMAGGVRVGTLVRIPLHGRRVGAWVTAVGVDPPKGVTLAAITKVTGWGPPPELLDLAGWAAWRWAGRPASLLRTASPSSVVRGVPQRPGRTMPVPVAIASDEVQQLAREALESEVAVVRLAPAVDPYPLLLAAAERGPVLIVAPTAPTARRFGLRLRRAGLPVAVMPDDWSLARAGWASVIGSRAAAWAPIASPSAVVVLDEHDESLQQEQAPTWHARDIAIERARRGGVPCLLVSPTPSLEALGSGVLLTQSRVAERRGWPIVDIVDRRDDAPGSGLFSERLVDALRGDGRVVCVLNRKGRSRLSVCARCGEVAACERCAAAVVQADDGSLVCLRCDEVRPQLCIRCGGSKMRNVRAGVTRVREELEALVREPVAEITGERAPGAGGTDARVIVGTEAALHQIRDADVVAFLDMDQELLAPRYRAAEEAMSLLVHAARLVGGRDRGGRLLIQTRLPDHEVLQAAKLADPARASAAELERRRLLGYPPTTAMAVVSGASAQAWIERFVAPPGVSVLGPSDGRWIIRAADHATLCDALATVVRPPGRVRVEVDPLRI